MYLPGHEAVHVPWTIIDAHAAAQMIATTIASILDATHATVELTIGPVSRLASRLDQVASFLGAGPLAIILHGYNYKNICFDNPDWDRKQSG